MKQIEGKFELTASDLVGFLNCSHLTELDRAVAQGKLQRPAVWDPLLDILRERGANHEQNYLDHLRASGLEVMAIDGADVGDASVAATLAAMKSGAAIIAQAALRSDGWIGRADILHRVEVPSALGEWSYEVIDTKLARETKAATVLQLCHYSDLLGKAQGLGPEHMYVVAPGSDYVPQPYRFSDYAAYFRKVSSGLLEAIARDGQAETYPDPKPHCEVCRWATTCDKRRRDDDHLCLVAGISKLQVEELNHRGVATVKGLADLPIPIEWKPDRGAVQSYNRVREQARVQVEARESGKPVFETLPVEPGLGLCLLPQPSKGDIFLDLEADPFVGEHGLEYLFGYQYADSKGDFAYIGDWAFTRADEKRAFETFMDFVSSRLKEFPDLHIYHYAPYEPSALKRLMGRYATRQEELDQFLRSGLFVDLYGVVRHAIRAGVESYSIKKLEPFYDFKREIPLGDAGTALASLQSSLELDDVPSVSGEIKAAVLGYNRDDCRSAQGLREWLESLRAREIAAGTVIPRPEPGDPAPTEAISAWLLRVNELIGRLTADIPLDIEERTEEQQARWILGNTLDWHRREQKAVWWEYFRLAVLLADELTDERAGLAGLTYLEPVGGTAKAPVHRYQFPPQETELRGGEDLRAVGGAKFGIVEAISFEDRTVDIKKRQDSAGLHPEAVFAHKVVDAQVLAEALFRLGEYVAGHGIEGEGSYQAGRDLLLKHAPRVDGAAIHQPDETTVEAAVRLAGQLRGGVFPIQGPPGCGKTYTGAQMICELVSLGKTVGITANSHKVIRNLIDATMKAANELGIALQCCQKADDDGPPHHRLRFAESNQDLFQSIGQGCQVAGGTAWLWARPEAFEVVDVLFVDEAAQMSLANVLAVSQAAKTIVLIGDPQQLDQPTKGSHPDGTDVSALHHILGGEQTIAPDKGLFLEETWRLHPSICAFTSELFYSGKLHSRKGLDRQTVKSTSLVNGSGLRYLPIDHTGNQNSSPEEADAIAQLVTSILTTGSTWIDAKGDERPITSDDILIITPYNAQVFELGRRLPNARIGTVDKFQGQEAPIAIYSMATSSPEDAPRGMEFLYSLNRFNVASSRAKCLSILVCSPSLFDAECRTPRQMQLANAFCRYLELARPLFPNSGL